MTALSNVRVRFAPSPTGYLHVGGARTALYCYLFAKRNKGTFVLRVEDTDLERSTEESLRMQVGDLHWLGLDWDEGIDPSTLADQGELGPYRQSRRLDIYRDHAEKLVEEGKAYYCFMTDDEITEQRAGLEQGQHIQSPYREGDLTEAKHRLEKGDQAVIRFKTPKEKRDYVLNDLVRKEVTFPSDMVGDFVLLRSTGMPVYNFCCAIDDHLMKMSHVLRAEEHLNNTLRQMMIYEAFGWELPQFGHMSIILGGDKQKLSKRHGATSVNEYNERGYLPEAMNNFLALLGWSSPEGKEIMSMNEMAESFSLDRLNAAPAVFDEVKLKWVNAMHLRALPDEVLWQKIEPRLKAAGVTVSADQDWIGRSLGLFKPYMETLADAVALYEPLSDGAFQMTDEGKETMSWETSKPVVEHWKSLIQNASQDYLSEEQFGEFQNNVKTACSVKGKHLFMPIRVAVVGKPHGAELKTLVPLLSKKELLDRADQALQCC